jgi:hypothetical protein
METLYSQYTLQRGSGTSGLVYVDSTQVQYQEEMRFRVSPALTTVL